MAKISDVSEIYRNVLDILMITILVDDRVRDEEQVELLHSACIHNRALHPDIILPPEVVRTYCDERSKELAQELATQGRDAVKEKYLIKIGDRGLQRKVLASIYAIATCDYELHDEERGLIKTALAVWQSKLPDPTEVEVVA
jgi:hypothetical protein